MDPDSLHKSVTEAVGSAAEHLWRGQRVDGGWTDRLSSSAIPTALAVLALARAGEQFTDAVQAGLAWLRANQRDDGGWAIADADPPSDPSVTAFAVAALRVLDPDATRCVTRGMEFITNHGGEDAVFPNVRTWRELVSVVWALEGLRDVHLQPVQPVEVMLFPPRLRNRASIALPGVISLGIGQTRVMPARWRPLRWARQLATPRGLAWLRSVQAANGGIEECPLMAAIVYMGLRTAGAQVGVDIQRGCLDYLLLTQRADGSWAIDRDLEIATTAYAVHALAEVGDVAAEPRLAPTREWLLRAQWQEAFPALQMPAGGWSWANPSGWPESEDTAVVLSTLRLLGVARDDAPVQAGLRWLLSRQNRDGSWSEWIRDSSMVHDGPCAGVTSHVVMALHQHGVPRGLRSPIQRALRYFQTTQQPDGAIGSLWFRDATHGTAKVLETYAELGLSADPVAQRCRRWLLATQREDGAWPATAREGAPPGPTAEETAWALYALLRAGEPPRSEPVARAVQWLVDRQDAAGIWQPSVVGLYYDQMYYSDDLIAHTYTLRALARWLSCVDTTTTAHP